MFSYIFHGNFFFMAKIKGRSHCHKIYFHLFFMEIKLQGLSLMNNENLPIFISSKKNLTGMGQVVLT